MGRIFLVPLYQCSESLPCLCLAEVGRWPTSSAGQATPSASPAVTGQVSGPLDTECSSVGDGTTKPGHCSRQGEDRPSLSPLVSWGESFQHRSTHNSKGQRHFEGKMDAPREGASQGLFG